MTKSSLTNKLKLFLKTETVYTNLVRNIRWKRFQVTEIKIKPIQSRAVCSFNKLNWFQSMTYLD